MMLGEKGGKDLSMPSDDVEPETHVQESMEFPISADVNPCIRVVVNKNLGVQQLQDQSCYSSGRSGDYEYFGFSVPFAGCTQGSTWTLYTQVNS